MSRQVVEVVRTIRERIGVDAAAAVDGSSPPTAAWKTPTGFPQRLARFFAYAIAARISCAVLESAGVVASCIDSALK